MVTGASRGIGAAVASAFAAAGNRVAGISRTGTAPDGVLAVSADVADPRSMSDAVRQAVTAVGDIEVLVAAAGIAADALAVRTGPELWERTVATNLTGSFHAVASVLPGMQRMRRGRIVLVSSVIAARGGVGLSAYGASKGGVEALTRSLAREVAARGITVNAVASGFIDTAMTAGMSPQARARYVEQIPAGRLGDPGEVVAPIVFLASPGASYITGAIVPVDGGMGMGR